MRHLLLLAVAMLLVWTSFSHAFAQMSIPGKFNVKKQQFETKDETVWIGFFNQGVATISKNGLVGLIDTSGQIVLNIEYDKITPVNHETATLFKGGKSGFIELKSKQVCAPFMTHLGDFQDRIAIYQNQAALYGLIKTDGTMLTEAKYSSISAMKEGRSLFFRDSILGMLTETGKEIILSHDFSQREYSDIAVSLSPTPKMLRMNDMAFIQNQYFSFEFHNGLAPFIFKDKEKINFGYINKAGITVIPAEYDKAFHFNNGMAIVVKKEKWGVIDSTGKILIPFQQTPIQQGGNHQFIVSKDGKYGLINSRNESLLPCKYAVLIHFKDDLYITHKNSSLFANAEKWGLINAEGKQILSFIYDAIIPAEDGKIIASWYVSNYSLNTGIPRYVYQGQYAFFDTQGKQLSRKLGFSKVIEGVSDWYNSNAIQFNPGFFAPNESKTEPDKTASEKYDYVEELYGGYKMVGITPKEQKSPPFFSHYGTQKAYKMGILNPEDEIVVPLIYDEIRYNGSNLLVVNQRLAPGDRLSPTSVYGVISIENKPFIPVAYDGIQLFSTAILVTKENRSYDKQGHVSTQWLSALFDLTGKEILPFRSGVSIYEDPTGQWSETINNKSCLIEKNR